MRWTIGLLLFAAAGCGYRQTKMVACPPDGCHHEYATSASPEGLPAPHEAVTPSTPTPPDGPLPDHTTPTPDVPPPAPVP